MKNVPYIFLREMKSYFVSPIAYVVLIIFVALSGLFFWSYFIGALWTQSEVGMRDVIYNMSIIMLFVIPLITMRLFAEEKRLGTIEILMTSPVSDAEAVIGKFCASLALCAIMLVLTFTAPLFLVVYSTRTPDMGAILVGYLGLFSLGAAYLSLGLATSTFTRNQMVAAITSFALLLGLWIIEWVSSSVSGTSRKVLASISVIEHFEDFTKGIIDTGHIVYFLSFTAFWLFVAIKSVQSAKWK